MEGQVLYDGDDEILQPVDNTIFLENSILQDYNAHHTKRGL